MFVVCSFHAVARPWARGMTPSGCGPAPQAATLTTRRSASSPSYSAFASAFVRIWRTCFGDLLGEAARSGPLLVGGLLVVASERHGLPERDDVLEEVVARSEGSPRIAFRTS